MTPLEKIKLLEAQSQSAGDLETLKALFYQLDEISRENSGNFDVQLAASDLRQRLLDKGNLLRKTEKKVRAAAPVPPPRPVSAPGARRKSDTRLWMALAAVLVILVGAGVVLARKRAATRAAIASGNIPLEIVTVPPGAAISVNGAAQCTSNCRVSFTAGNNQITADLEGYEPAVSEVTLVSGKPASLVLPLEAHVALRIFTDLDQGKVGLDNQPPADLMDGQFQLAAVAPGTHIVKITGRTGDASLTFEAYNSKPPVVGAVTARNLIAVAVASLGNQARVVTNTGPFKLAVNGQPEADAVPSGIDLKAFQQGVNELVIGEGKDQYSVKESFGAIPMLTVSLKSDINAGTLIVSTGEDDVRVLLNGKEYRRKTQHGEVRIQTIGKVNVQVAKDGFDPVAPVTAEVKKGAETRLEFKLNRTPTTATLQIAGAMPGAEVLIDQRTAGVIGLDGSFTDSNLTPGDHAIELRHEHFVPKRYQRMFNAGQTLTIAGPEVLLVAERLPPPPPPAEKKPEPVKEKAPLPPAVGTVADFDDPSQWHPDGSGFVHHGAGFLSFKMPPQGVFTFTVQPRKGGLFREGKVRWRLMYTDNRNFAEFEIDKNNFICRVVQDGRAAERTRTSLKDLDKQKEFTIQIDVTQEHIVHKLRAGSGWAPLDAWSEPGIHFAQGKFGFFLPGNDEIELTNFKFQPK